MAYIQFFNDIENIVKERMNLTDDNSYEKTVKNSEIFVKYPMCFFMGVLNVFATVMIGIVPDVMNGKTDVQNWTLPYRYK